jgi:hypothetical protein
VPKAAHDPAHAILASDVAKYCRDPLGYVRYSFPKREPRQWQASILSLIRDHFSSPNWDDLLQIAVASGHGVGKSAVVGMIISWAMSTCAGCRMVITANTFDQLTYQDLAGSYQMGGGIGDLSSGLVGALGDLFNLSSTGPGYEVASGCNPVVGENRSLSGAAQRGQAGNLLIFDEASAIDDKVWEVAEGALTDEEHEKLWLAFGNPTQNTGRFMECFGQVPSIAGSTFRLTRAKSKAPTK